MIYSYMAVGTEIVGKDISSKDESLVLSDLVSKDNFHNLKTGCTKCC